MEGTRRRSKLLHHLALYILCAQGMIAYREAVVLHQGDSAFIWKTRSFAQRAGIHLFTNMAVPSYFEEYRKMVRKRVNDIKRGSELTGIRSREEDLLVKLTDYPQETSWINGVFCEFPSYHRETIIHQIGDIPFVPVDKISKIFVKPLWNIPVPTMAYNQDLKETVERISRNGRIILSVSDKSYTSMTQNFIETSIRPFNFTNHLVVGLSSNFCESLNSSISACFEFNRHHKGGNFGSAEFANLVNVKTEAMLAILLLGYDVLLADVDIVFLRDPLNDLVREEYEQYDLLIQDDLHSPNSGFMLLRSNSVGVTFAGEALRQSNYGTSSSKRQQTAMEAAIRSMKQFPLKMKLLSRTKYPVGLTYFAKTRRLFAGQNDCETCIIVHNNFIVGKQAKIFRFKEHLMWAVDDPPGYYTDENQKFIEFGNPDPKVTLEEEVQALLNALMIGDILGRSIILPRFRCRKCDWDIKEECTASNVVDDACPLNAHWSVNAFFKAFHHVRENMFRYNDRIPEHIQLGHGNKSFEKSSIIPYLLYGRKSRERQTSSYRLVGDSISIPYFGNKFGDEHILPTSQNVYMIPDDLVTDENILDWFGNLNDAVLRFHWLYGIEIAFLNSTVNEEWRRKAKSAFVRSDIRQFSEMGTVA